MASFFNLICSSLIFLALLVSSESIAATGSGGPPPPLSITFSPDPNGSGQIDFGQVTLGQSSQPQYIQIFCNPDCPTLTDLGGSVIPPELAYEFAQSNQFGSSGYIKLVWTPTFVGTHAIGFSRNFFGISSAAQAVQASTSYSLLITVVAPPPVPPVLTAVPSDGSSLNFGDVTVGQSATRNISVSCEHCTSPVSVQILSSAPPFAIQSSSVSASGVDFAINFSPVAAGVANGIFSLVVTGTNSDGVTPLTLSYNLTGNGIAIIPTPPALMADILAAFHQGEQDGTIEGVGKNARSQTAHLDEFQTRLDKLSQSINKGKLDKACKIVARLIVLSDANSVKPARKDIIQGTAVAALNAQLVELQGLLGCPAPSDRDLDEDDD